MANHWQRHLSQPRTGHGGTETRRHGERRERRVKLEAARLLEETLARGEIVTGGVT